MPQAGPNIIEVQKDGGLDTHILDTNATRECGQLSCSAATELLVNCDTESVQIWWLEVHLSLPVNLLR